jgi:hypothetical protein
MSCIAPFNIHKSKVQVIDKHKSNPQLHIGDHCFLHQCKHNLSHKNFSTWEHNLEA